MMKLWRFSGGIKLSSFKQLANAAQIKTLPIPRQLVIPLRQHIGDTAEPIVTVGEKVYKGQVIATSNAFISAPIHASSSGTVIDINQYPVPHQSGIAETCIVIETDGLDQWLPQITAESHPDTLSADEMRTRIRQAGIVGLGGAVFPSAAKLKPTRTIETLIINGVECEPYITCDDALMRAYPERIIRGILLLRRLLQPVDCIIAIEDNKPEAIAAMEATLTKLTAAGVKGANTIRVVAVPTIFPAGGEKQLIKVLTGKEVPQQGLPYEVGVVCLNVGTTAAIYDALYAGQPLVSRVVTVSGAQIREPANYEVLIGTPVEHILAAAGGVRSERYKLIMGGPMMGQSLPHGQVPIVKASNCVLVAEAANEMAKPVMPCIRCGACAGVCPMKLLPQQLYWHARGKSFDKLTHYHLADCIECGCCAVVCPAKIPLVQYFRYAKSEKQEHEIKARFADQSRRRTQAREARLERLKREQEARKAARKAARQQKTANEDAAPAAPKQVSSG